MSDTGDCYLIQSEEPASWYTASEACSDLQGSLVSLYSDDSSSSLTSLLTSHE